MLQYSMANLFEKRRPIKHFCDNRRDFGAYARRAVRRLAKNMEQTSSSLQSSKWLAGARVIYEAVKARRSAISKDTKSFADWIGLQQFSSAVNIGMSLTCAVSTPCLSVVCRWHNYITCLKHYNVPTCNVCLGILTSVIT